MVALLSLVQLVWVEPFLQRELQVEYHLWQLYHVEKDLESQTKDLGRAQEVGSLPAAASRQPGLSCRASQKLGRYRSELEGFDADLKEQLAQHARARRSITEKDKKLTKLTRKLEKMVRLRVSPPLGLTLHAGREGPASRPR